MKIDFHVAAIQRDNVLKYAIILSRFKDGNWVFVRHKERSTWEIPAGHIEANEPVLSAAKRELYEETGATKFYLTTLFDYSICVHDATTYGRLFYAEIHEIGQLPDFEIAEILFCTKLPVELTYPEIQTILFQKAIRLIS